MDFYPLDLAGKTYRLRFTPDDIRDICRRLTPMQPPGGQKVAPPTLGQMLVNYDPDAIEHCLMFGLRHMADYKKIDLTDVQKLVKLHIDDGGQYTDFRLPLFRGLVACGLADFAPVLKVVEEEEAKRRAESGEEANLGNGSTTPSPSATRTLTSVLPQDESDSST